LLLSLTVFIDDQCVLPSASNKCCDDMADLGPLDIETVSAGPNHVIGPDVELPVAGLWTFDVTARFGEFDQVVFTVEIPVSD